MSVVSIDDYKMQVYLKDDSIYAYIPRRFAYAKRMQIRKITDDLQKREIIQCLAKLRSGDSCEKNGQMRLCVDLRP